MISQRNGVVFVQTLTSVAGVISERIFQALPVAVVMTFATCRIPEKLFSFSTYFAAKPSGIATPLVVRAA